MQQDRISGEPVTRFRCSIAPRWNKACKYSKDLFETNGSQQLWAGLRMSVQISTVVLDPPRGYLLPTSSTVYLSMPSQFIDIHQHRVSIPCQAYSRLLWYLRTPSLSPIGLLPLSLRFMFWPNFASQRMSRRSSSLCALFFVAPDVTISYKSSYVLPLLVLANYLATAHASQASLCGGGLTARLYCSEEMLRYGVWGGGLFDLCGIYEPEVGMLPFLRGIVRFACVHT